MSFFVWLDVKLNKRPASVEKLTEDTVASPGLMVDSSTASLRCKDGELVSQ